MRRNTLRREEDGFSHLSLTHCHSLSLFLPRLHHLPLRNTIPPMKDPLSRIRVVTLFLIIRGRLLRTTQFLLGRPSCSTCVFYSPSCGFRRDDEGWESRLFEGLLDYSPISLPPLVFVCVFVFDLSPSPSRLLPLPPPGVSCSTHLRGAVGPAVATRSPVLVCRRSPSA